MNKKFPWKTVTAALILLLVAVNVISLAIAWRGQPAILTRSESRCVVLCTPTPEPGATDTPAPTDTPAAEPTDTPEPQPTDTPEPQPTDTPRPTPTSGPRPTPSPGLRAFPEAEGFGAQSVGGRGGRVIEVTNLNDSGSGSLRAAVEASGPRTVVFRTGGTIELQSTLSIRNPYITIAGQTAPGGGITLRGGTGIRVRTHDVVIRYLAVRPGAGGSNIAILIAQSGSSDVYNIVIDHCSLSWATDEVMTTWYRPYDVSIQWSIISEGLNCSTHPEGCHSKGSLLGGYKDDGGGGLGAFNISFHHNLLAHHSERGPMVKTGGLVDIVNNVTYNMGGINSHVFVRSPGLDGVIPVNWVANYYKFGPSTGYDKYEIGSYYESGEAKAHIYLEGNIGPHRPNDTLPEDALFKPNSQAYVLVNERHDAPPVTTLPALDVYDWVLAEAGAAVGLDAQGDYYQRRDAVDVRIIGDVRNGTGSIIDDPSEVGGWPEIDVGTPYSDTDRDGMADEWEMAHFDDLEQGGADDSSSDFDGDGWTDLEEFLNGTDPLN